MVMTETMLIGGVLRFRMVVDPSSSSTVGCCPGVAVSPLPTVSFWPEPHSGVSVAASAGLPVSSGDAHQHRQSILELVRKETDQ